MFDRRSHYQNIHRTLDNSHHTTGWLEFQWFQVAAKLVQLSFHWQNILTHFVALMVFLKKKQESTNEYRPPRVSGMMIAFLSFVNDIWTCKFLQTFRKKDRNCLKTRQSCKREGLTSAIKSFPFVESFSRTIWYEKIKVKKPSKTVQVLRSLVAFSRKKIPFQG